MNPVIGIPGYQPGDALPTVGAPTVRGLMAGDQLPWTHKEFGIDKLYDQGVRGGHGAEVWDRAVVVVIDTAGTSDHTDLVGNLDGGRSKSFTGEPPRDGNGHGTHCAGIVCADDNGGGVRGVAPNAAVILLKALTNGGSGYGDQIAAAIRYAADLTYPGGRPAHVIYSLSFGAAGEDSRITEAIRYAHGKGHWLCAAAGNDGPGSINWPGALEEVICVASVDKGGGVSSFSSANDSVDVGFGGRDILSTYPGGKLATLSGTSMATPGVAGVLALGVGELLRLGRPIPDQGEMTTILYATCTTPDKRTIYTGNGLVRPAKFVAALLAATEPAPPPPPPPVRVAIPEGARFVVFE